MKSRTIERNMFYNASPDIFEKARALRFNMTPEETLLWNRLKKSQLNGYRFKPQHPINKFIADFYCHKAQLVIEVDGLYHLKQREYDEGRTAELEKMGIKVVRFSNDDILNDLENVIKEIICLLPNTTSP